MAEANKEKKPLGLRLRNALGKVPGLLKKLKPAWLDKHDAIALLGVVSIVKGISMYSHPLAYIAAGMFMLALSFMSAQPEPKQERQ